VVVGNERVWIVSCFIEIVYKSKLLTIVAMYFHELDLLKRFF